MQRYIIQRLALAVPVIVMVTMGVFLLVRIIPGDVAVLRLGADATEEDLQQFREAHGLTRPLIVQYGDWMWGALRGDLGESLWEGRPIFDIVREKFPVTAELAVMAIVMAAVVGTPLGAIAAVKQDGVLDQGLRVGAMLFLAVPSFWLAILLITFPSIWWGWTPPTSGFEYPWENLPGNLYRMVWPAAVAAAATLALVLRLARSSMVEVLQHDYIRTARAKGLRERSVIGRHALRNAVIPVVTVLGLQLSVLFGGAVIVEQVFAIPGMGRSLLQAVFQRDYALIQAYVLIFALMYVVMNLAVDILYTYLDPRIRYSV